MSEEVKERKQRIWTTRKRRKRCRGCGELFPRAELSEKDGLCPDCRTGGMNVDGIPDDIETPPDEGEESPKVEFFEVEVDEETDEKSLIPYPNGNGNYRECFACNSRIFFYLGDGVIECTRCHARIDVVRRDG